MTNEGDVTFSVVSVVEDFLRQNGTRLSDTDLASRQADLSSRKADEAAMRRFEAAGWLRSMVGAGGARDLPDQPSEEEFRLGLRNGRILGNVLNKVQPGSVPKVVESPCDPDLIPDGAALTAYQYFENIRNVLLTIGEMGIPSFEASDLEQGGKSSRIVNCILALKSYNDWKQAGGTGLWKYSGNLKPTIPGKFFLRKSDPFTNCLSRKSSDLEHNLDNDLGHYRTEMNAHSLSVLVRELLSNRRPDELPTLVESMLGKITEDFERRLASQKEAVERSLSIQNESAKTTSEDPPVFDGIESISEITSDETKLEEDVVPVDQVEYRQKNYINEEESKMRSMKQEQLFDIQKREIQEIRETLHTTKEGMQFMQTKYSEEFNNLGKYLTGLANAASRYHQVVEENRKLYNQVQDLKGSIRVYCRVRPFMPGQEGRTSCVDNIDEGSISILVPSKYVKEGRKSFRFNKVFGPSTTQAEVFSDTQALIRSVLDGFNVCIFAYGQTGSGKTHTMTGPKILTEETQGVNYRALGDLFQLAQQRKETVLYEVSVQMIEIYNEQVRDLLAPDGANKKVEIRNTSQKGFNVPDANILPVTSTSDVLDLMDIGHGNRAVSSTALNDRSSRSHSCLTVHVQGKDLTTGAVLRGCMHLVDLAGSERVDKSEVVGDRLKEAQHINKSLSSLGDVISSLAQKNGHVPYRNSKLTQLLQDSLGGQAKTLMFVHIAPEPEAIGETISTLKFAERVATVELGAARSNRDGGDVRELKEQIASLKEALARKEAEPAGLQRTTSSSPDRLSMKAGTASPFSSNRQGRGDRRSGHSSASSSPERLRRKAGGSSPLLYNSQLGADRPSRTSSASSSPERPRLKADGSSNLHRQVGGDTKPNGNSARRQLFDELRKLDLQEALTRSRSAPWPPGTKGLEKEDRDLGTGEWVDKVIVKEDVVDGEEVQWGGEESQLPHLFYQKPLPDSSKIFPDQPFNRFTAGKLDNRFDVASTDGSDDMDLETGDSAEVDLLWQLSLPRVANGMGSKIKKPQSKLSNSPDKSNIRRSSIPTLIPSPSPSRRLSTGASPPLHRNGRQLASADGKRRPSYRK